MPVEARQADGSPGSEVGELFRIFIAIELLPQLHAGLERVQQRCKTLLAENARAVRWSAVAGIHITLAFLGETPVDRLPAINDALRQAVQGVAPFSLRAAGLGCFPNPHKARVVWVGVAGDLPDLRRLHAAVEQALQPLGYRPEYREYSPHLTLGRVRDDTDPATRRVIGELVMELNRNALPELAAVETLRVEQISVMRSILKPAGAEYTALSHVELLPG